jgi:hypothetical protein
MIAQRGDGPHGVHHSYHWLVQTPKAFFVFMVFGKDEAPAEVRSVVRGVVESFRLTDGDAETPN